MSMQAETVRGDGAGREREDISIYPSIYLQYLSSIYLLLLAGGWGFSCRTHNGGRGIDFVTKKW